MVRRPEWQEARMRRGVTGCFERMSARDAGFVFDEEPRRLEMLVACYLF